MLQIISLRPAVQSQGVAGNVFSLEVVEKNALFWSFPTIPHIARLAAAVTSQEMYLGLPLSGQRRHVGNDLCKGCICK